MLSKFYLEQTQLYEKYSITSQRRNKQCEQLNDSTYNV